MSRLVEVDPKDIAKLDIKCLSPLTLLDLFPTIKYGVTTGVMVNYIYGLFKVSIKTYQPFRVEQEHFKNILREENIIGILSNAIMCSGYISINSNNFYEFIEWVKLYAIHYEKSKIFDYMKDVVLDHHKINPVIFCTSIADQDVTKIY